MDTTLDNFADKTAKEQRGRPFKPGQSGNPSGRPKGSLNKATIIAQALLEGEAEALTRKIIEMALEGDSTSLRLAMERILAKRRDNHALFELPAIESADDISRAITEVISAVSVGQLTPSEGKTITDMLEQQRKAFETGELERKLSSLQRILSERK